MARRGMARARLPVAAASRGRVEETRLDGDLAERDLDAAEVGLHDRQQVGQGAGPVRAGLAHRDDLVLVDAGPQQCRDPIDMGLEGVGEVPVLFGRRRRRIGHQEKLLLCMHQRGG